MIICSKKLRATSAGGEVNSPNPTTSHAEYQRQVEQIRLLAAHYRPPMNPEREDPLHFKITGSFQEQEAEHMLTGTSAMFYNKLMRENKEPVHQQGLVNTDKDHSEEKVGVCAHECCNCKNPVAVTGEKIKVRENAGKFTPAAFLAGKGFLLKGDNHSANWDSASTCRLQPMKLSETGASVINMPSLLQGQAFSDPIPPLHHGSAHRLRNSQPAASIEFSYPAPPPSDCSSCCLQGQFGMGTAGTGWKRRAHSATMYTRYRSPEYALMYSDLESSSTSTASGVWASNDIGCRKFRKLR